MKKKAPKSIKQANDLSGAVFEDVQRSRRSKNIIVKHDKTGATSAVDKRQVAKDVVNDQALKEVLQEDVMMLFENYLTSRVPYILAKALKDAGFKNGEQPFLPHELHNIYRRVVSENVHHHGALKTHAVLAVKRPFKEFMKNYVEIIVENINK